VSKDTFFADKIIPIFRIKPCVLILFIQFKTTVNYVLSNISIIIIYLLSVITKQFKQIAHFQAKFDINKNKKLTNVYKYVCKLFIVLILN